MDLANSPECLKINCKLVYSFKKGKSSDILILS